MVMYKNRAVLLFLLILFSSVAVYADYTTPVVVQGVIGDYSKMSRDYEIGGNIYSFPPNITLEDRHGNRVSYSRLKSGVRVKVIGEKTVGDSENGTVEYRKIIFLGQ